MEYEFDPAKDILNQRKHGLPMTAADFFDWDTAQIREDDRFDYPEQRFEATGYIGRRLHVLIFCLNGEKTRLISLRRAEKYEERRYAKAQT